MHYYQMFYVLQKYAFYCIYVEETVLKNNLYLYVTFLYQKKKPNENNTNTNIKQKTNRLFIYQEK